VATASDEIVQYGDVLDEGVGAIHGTTNRWEPVRESLE
jgi:hypothetical protein